MIQLLYTRFRMTLVLCIIYMILSISLHTWHVTIHWSMPLKHYWTKGFHTLYSAHRTGTILKSLEYHLVDKYMISRVLCSCSAVLLLLQKSFSENRWSKILQRFCLGTKAIEYFMIINSMTQKIICILNLI